MYSVPPLVLLGALSLFILSKIANYFLAKRPEIKWIFLAVMGSAVIALISYIGLTFVIALLDLPVTDPSQTLAKLHPLLVMVISSVVILLLSSVAFKVINQMCWPSAITTNFVSVVIVTIALSGSLSLNDNRAEKLVTAKSVPSEQVVDKSIDKNINKNIDKCVSVANVLSPN